MARHDKKNGEGFFISMFLIIVLISIFLLPDIGQEFSLPALKFPGIEANNIKSAIAAPLIDLSFKYIGANEYVANSSQKTSGLFIIDDDIVSILILGIAGEGHVSPHLTDSILVVRLDLDAKKVTAVSLPRDLLVKIPGGNTYTKINSLYLMGLTSNTSEPTQLIEKKVEEIVGFPISRYVVLDLASLEQVVDTLGGISLYVPGAINDTNFPTPDGGYTVFAVERGWQHFDGKTLTKYIRTRHTPKGDIERIGRQQRAAIALKEKISGLHPIFNLKTIFDILNSLKGHLKTDLAPEEITYLWSNQRNFSESDVVFHAIDAFEKDSLLISKSETLGGEKASVLIPRVGVENYEEIREFVQNLINHE